MIPIYRSWPDREPAGRAHVVDDLPKLRIHDHDLGSYGRLPPTPFILLEWDIAVERLDMECFQGSCTTQSHQFRVMPYRLYNPGTRPDDASWVWAHSAGLVPGERWIHTNEPTCDHFGFGAVYFPRGSIEQFREENPSRPLTDTNFCLWRMRFRPALAWGPVPVEWGCHPVHLHA